jgi:hypothetical protein
MRGEGGGRRLERGREREGEGEGEGERERRDLAWVIRFW